MIKEKCLILLDIGKEGDYTKYRNVIDEELSQYNNLFVPARFFIETGIHKECEYELNDIEEMITKHMPTQLVYAKLNLNPQKPSSHIRILLSCATINFGLKILIRDILSKIKIKTIVIDQMMNNIQLVNYKEMRYKEVSKKLKNVIKY